METTKLYKWVSAKHDGSIHEIWKWINTQPGEELVWSHTWDGKHCIGQDCEDQAEDYYEEWWDEDENDGKEPKPPVPDNQLCMPFIFDELNIEQSPEVSDTTKLNRDSEAKYTTNFISQDSTAPIKPDLRRTLVQQ